MRIRRGAPRWRRTGIFPVLLAFGRSIALAGALGLVRPAFVEGQPVVRSWLDWRTRDTDRYTLHYPTELAAWATHVAGRIDAIDSVVGAIVGYRTPGRTQVVIDDPYATANGSAWPSQRDPTIVLWATPPMPRASIGAFAHWGEMVTAHEIVHLAHLTAASRNPLLDRLWRLSPIPIGPVTRKAPPWVYEGYATHVEGLITGSGRPPSAWRAGILRQLALEGRLPSYAGLNGAAVFLGGDMPYLVGSAYLEWLVARQGDSSLVHLWRRLTALEDRSFDAAFAGVFGRPAAELYGDFVSEVTASAHQVRAALREAGSDTGQVVQRLTYLTGEPAISPDGRHVAFVRRERNRAPRTVVIRTTEPPDTTAARRAAERQRRDPLDVPARLAYPLPRKAVATLPGVGALAYEGPRFLADGRVLVWRMSAEQGGGSRPDLHIWNPATGEVHRVTRGASLRDGDPHPTGEQAIALQCRGGACSIVKVDLRSGQVRTIAAGSPTRSYSRPRYSPNGLRWAAAAHVDGRWRIVLGDSAGVADTVTADDANRYDPDWRDDGSLIVASDAGGVIHLAIVHLARRATAPVAFVSGSAVAPAVNRADGSLWFLSLHARGYDLRRIDSIRATGVPMFPASAWPAVPTPVGPGAVTLPVESPSPERRYGTGPRRTIWFPLGIAGVDGAGAGAAIVNSDPVGRLELLAQGLVAEHDQWNGASVAATWRGLPITIAAGAAAGRAPRDARSDVKFGWGALFADRGRDRSTLRASALVGHGILVGSDTAGSHPIVVTEASATRRFHGDGRTAWAMVGHQTALRIGGNGEGPLLRWSGELGTAGPRTLPVRFTAHFGMAERSEFAIGGLANPLLPPLLDAGQLRMPLLPSAAASGPRAFAGRAAITHRGVELFAWSGCAWQHRCGDGAAGRGWQRVVGAEGGTGLGAIGPLGTPAFRVRTGAGYLMDEPMRRRLAAYLSVQLGDWW